MVKNLHKLLRNSYTLTLYIAFLIPSIFIWYHYSALDYVAANYQSYFFAYSDAFLSWCAILLFPLLLTGIVYRSMIFGTRE